MVRDMFNEWYNDYQICWMQTLCGNSSFIVPSLSVYFAFFYILNNLLGNTKHRATPGCGCGVGLLRNDKPPTLILKNDCKH